MQRGGSSVVEDYDLRRRVLRVVFGKGNKERLVPLNQSAAEDLERWMYKPGLGDHGTDSRCECADAPTSRRTSRSSGRGSRARCTGWRTWPEWSVSLRTISARTMITELLARGVDVLVVGRIVGHQNPHTTLIYDRRPVDAQIAAAAHLFMPAKPKKGGSMTDKPHGTC